MLIEYKFKFEKNGLSVTQRFEPGTSDSHATIGPVVEQNSLRATYQESKAVNAMQPKTAQPKAGGNGFGRDPGGPGGGSPSSGTAPVTFIGPFIMCCPSEDSQKKDKE